MQFSSGACPPMGPKVSHSSVGARTTSEITRSWIEVMASEPSSETSSRGVCVKYFASCWHKQADLL